MAVFDRGKHRAFEPWIGLPAAMLLAAICGCASTYGPPMRMQTFGAPGGVGAGQIETGAVGHGRLVEPYFLRPGGGPVLAVGVTDWLALEGTYDWTNDLYASGSGALRITLPKKWLPRKGIADFALGGGAGRGGMLCDNKSHGYDYPGDPDVNAVGIGTLASDFECPGDRWWDWKGWIARPYGGGFVDVGIGSRTSKRMITYARLRFQMTKAENIPLTAWYALGAGAEVELFGPVHGHFGVGLTAWHNKFDHPFDHLDREYGVYNIWLIYLDNNLDIYLELGLTMKFDLLPES